MYCTHIFEEKKNPIFEFHQYFCTNKTLFVSTAPFGSIEYKFDLNCI